MQSEIDGPSETDWLKQYISELKAENNKIRAENLELKARIAKLEDKQLQNEMVKNLANFSQDILPNHVNFLPIRQLNQLPRSIKIDIWRRLTSRKYPLSLEQASSIHSEVEDLLNKAVENYIKKKEHQKMKGTEPITSDCETSLRQENEEL
ncbi:hypothetical protein RhiirA1_477834, partial [Rhizophagus irregularis]